jgi:enoyl-CoA hydratase/carnithine racemase
VFDELRVERRQAVLVVTINRPDRMTPPFERSWSLARAIAHSALAWI